MDLHVFPIPIPPPTSLSTQIPLGLPSAPGPSTCLMHPTWFSTTAFVLSNKHLLMMTGTTLKILNVLSYLILTKLSWFLSYMD